MVEYRNFLLFSALRANRAPRECYSEGCTVKKAFPLIGLAKTGGEVKYALLVKRRLTILVPFKQHIILHEFRKWFVPSGQVGYKPTYISNAALKIFELSYTC